MQKYFLINLPTSKATKIENKLIITVLNFKKALNLSPFKITSKLNQ